MGSEKGHRINMLAMFRRKTAPPSDAPSATPSLKGSLRPESAAALLATPRRKRLIEHIWQRTSLSRAQFSTLYGAPLERYAALVQQFPASESHHHAYPGGLLDHGLEIVAYALKLRQSYLLPIGAPPEMQAAQAEAWTAAAAYAALLHAIAVNLRDHEEILFSKFTDAFSASLVRGHRIATQLCSLGISSALGTEGIGGQGATLKTNFAYSYEFKHLIIHDFVVRDRRTADSPPQSATGTEVGCNRFLNDIATGRANARGSTASSDTIVQFSGDGHLPG